MSEKFSLDLIYDLHAIVGCDAVTEAYESLPDEDKEDFLKALKEYRETKYWRKYDRSGSDTP